MQGGAHSGNLMRTGDAHTSVHPRERRVALQGGLLLLRSLAPSAGAGPTLAAAGAAASEGPPLRRPPRRRAHGRASAWVASPASSRTRGRCRPRRTPTPRPQRAWTICDSSPLHDLRLITAETHAHIKMRVRTYCDSAGTLVRFWLLLVSGRGFLRRQTAFCL